METEHKSSAGKPWKPLRKTLAIPLLVFLICALGITAAGWLFFEHAKRDVEQDAQHNLMVIADLKISQIVNWRRERLGDAVEAHARKVVYQGRPVRMTTIHDITERKRAEEALREAHEVLQRRATELEAFNWVMVDREQRIIEMKEEVNALCRELGREPEYPPVWRKGV